MKHNENSRVKIPALIHLRLSGEHQRTATRRVCSAISSIVPIAAVSCGFIPTRRTKTSNTSAVPITRRTQEALAKPDIM